MENLSPNQWSLALINMKDHMFWESLYSEDHPAHSPLHLPNWHPPIFCKDDLSHP